MQATMKSGKKRGPQPTGVGSPVVVRCKPEFLDAIDDWRSKQRPIPSRPEALRQLAEMALGQAGITIAGRGDDEAS